MYSRGVGRLHFAEFGRGPAYEKIADQLSRGLIISPAQRKGMRLPAALEFDSGKRIAGIILFRSDADNDAAVRIALVARILAHAVGDDTSRL